MMSADIEKSSPHNIQAEEAVLGALLIDAEAIYRVLPFLHAEDFFLEKHRLIYEAIMALHEQRVPLDLLTLTAELERKEYLVRVGGPAYLAQLINAVPSAINVESYARLVEQAAVRRRLLEAASTIAQLAYKEDLPIEQVVDRAEQAIFGVSEKRVTRDLQPIQEVLNNYYDYLANLAGRGGPMGVPTGFADLNKLLGGFQRSDLVILAARPGVGKTSLMLNFALHAAQERRTVGIFSLEMSAEQIAQRLVSATSGIDAQRLRLGEIEDDEWGRLTDAIGRLAELPIYIDDTPAASPLQVRTKCRRLQSERGLDMVIVDYLQLMSADLRTENRVQEVSYISRMLKALARELDVPVIAASQLSRAVEQRADKRPVLSDLRESGCLTGDTLVRMADGQSVPIRRLAEEGIGAPVLALDLDTWRLVATPARKAWRVGVAPIFRLATRLGRALQATANHPFLTPQGWRRLDQLAPGDWIALPAAPTAPAADGASAPAPRGDVLWDRIVALDAAGEAEVFDLEVPAHNNFIANEVIVHNSLEQDADVVMFIYREDPVTAESLPPEKANLAEIIVAKHRSGPTGTVTLYFNRRLTEFRDVARVAPPGQEFR